MSCKLYIKYGKEEKYIGCFKNREQAQKEYEIHRAQLRSELGRITSPIYVDTGKGRGK